MLTQFHTTPKTSKNYQWIHLWKDAIGIKNHERVVLWYSTSLDTLANHGAALTMAYRYMRNTNTKVFAK